MMVTLRGTWNPTVHDLIVALLALRQQSWRPVDAWLEGVTAGPALVSPCLVGPTLLLLRY